MDATVSVFSPNVGDLEKITDLGGRFWGVSISRYFPVVFDYLTTGIKCLDLGFVKLYTHNTIDFRFFTLLFDVVFLSNLLPFD